MRHRFLILAMVAALPLTMAGCDDAKGPGSGKPRVIDTSYPGPFDEKLTEAQREELRARVNNQR